ncbi:MAG: hypothetical protein FWE72_05120, partial [Spirochaetaceae bacterium]|nr:hypothetical protein [Spirochaetaceae bacterium]
EVRIAHLIFYYIYICIKINMPHPFRPWDVSSDSFKTNMRNIDLTGKLNNVNEFSFGNIIIQKKS